MSFFDKKQTSQNQESGDHSVNYQAGNDITVHQHGLSYSDVRDICKDVFESNFIRLSEQSANIARERSEEWVRKLIEEIRSKEQNILDNFIDPGVQHALVTAQIEYAKSGDPVLGEMLVKTLVERASETDRSLLQIALSEAVSVIPKLTIRELSMVSIVFALRYCKMGIQSLNQMKEYLQKLILIAERINPITDSSFTHIEYTGCGSVDLTVIRVEELLGNAYRGLFCKGFSAQEYLEVLGEDGLPQQPVVVNCLHDMAKFQLLGIDKDEMKRVLEERVSDSTIADALMKLHESRFMSNQEIKEYVINNVDQGEFLINLWETTHLKNLKLTSVGLVVGITNLRRVTDYTFDMKIWVS